MSRPKGTINYASLEKSPRLQRLLDFLRDCKEHTTLEIIQGANIAAVSASVTELRRNIAPYGMDVTCRKLDRNRYAYQLVVMGRAA